MFLFDTDRGALGRTDRERLRRIEAKLDLTLEHLGIDYVDAASPGSLSEEARALARQRRGKIAAIKLHRAQTGAGLREAKDAVEAYLASSRS